MFRVLHRCTNGDRVIAPRSPGLDVPSSEAALQAAVAA
jgi:hypothetical protein